MLMEMEFEQGNDDRIIYIFSEITAETAMVVTSAIINLSRISDEDPIWIVINSEGGSVVDGIAIMDTIELCPAPIYTLCAGEATSMGAYIFAMGDEGHRYITRNSRISLHNPSYQCDGEDEISPYYASDLNDYLGGAVVILHSALANACGKPIETIARDVYARKSFTAPMAVDYGIANEILTEFKF